MEQRKVNFLPNDSEGQSWKIQKSQHRKNRFWIISIIVVFLLGGCLTYGLMPASNPGDTPESYDPITLEPVEPQGFFQRLKHLVFNKEAKLAGEKKDRINILLLGMGGLGHDGPYLTDTLMVASIKPSTNEVALISIPRDLAVNIPGYGIRKINNVNAFGETKKKNFGPAFVSDVFKKTFDLDIHYYLRVDFKAFTQIIDDIGGVKVDVEKSFVDQQYPAPNDAYQVIKFDKGIQTMDGDTALKFARSRHGNNGEGSDFARARRQQKVLLAVKEKLISFKTLINPIRINNILNTLQENISTNMSFSDIIGFLKMSKDFDSNNISTLVLDNGVNGYLKNTFSENGAYLLEPVSGNYDDIKDAMKNIFDKDFQSQIRNFSIGETVPAQDKPDVDTAKIEIQNGTWRAGLAARVKKTLNDKNIDVTILGNTQERPYMQSGIYDLSSGEFSSTVEDIADTLHIPIKKSPPENETYDSKTQIYIILGEDFQET
ncbi:MAG: hypothetical protein COV59_04260 [Candidatus Magasanikbacteria bacterium CG11_big_fil_rev_8_21_14_0_20_39_34]|uniref:Cell envelope-related transcriptional attenuator domain-containing protein n=1 Tax=Candidatus Magasanikbacteria bacterium CG11_big_fil_rev_8_21_14_0_20_39_34 TaxID=1974653 RepID=A0A2H0N4M8_9BACT|nr:MAG: hypothetical protein COV59_04260 [Candidatus Magasanikbacteria bacterium CG11_big_fil_rev_8_21_14_0_20_39_34]